MMYSKPLKTTAWQPLPGYATVSLPVTCPQMVAPPGLVDQQHSQHESGPHSSQSVSSQLPAQRTASTIDLQKHMPHPATHVAGTVSVLQRCQAGRQAHPGMW